MAQRESLIAVGSALLLGVVSTMAWADPPGSRKIDASQAPEAVRRAVTREVGDARLDEVHRLDRNGKTLYEVEFDRDWQEHTVVLNDAGDVVERAVEIAVADIPAAVLQTVKALRPDATIDEAERITVGDKTEYEISIDLRNGEERELRIDAAGGLLDERDDD